ncbi:hypothetical protein [Pandoraea sp. CB10b_02]|nr:hypothetical protein [Pandoraea sp. CB10b_02]
MLAPLRTCPYMPAHAMMAALQRIAEKRSEQPSEAVIEPHRWLAN